ncbi:hypothetical protein [Kitasatospora sp. NPDC059327]|uniref:hypothetical protein n=1 Tax=Kitasatospora sp. NPDC059327 TaxID=3346803 RepID=UPI0036CB993A
MRRNLLLAAALTAAALTALTGCDGGDRATASAGTGGPAAFDPAEAVAKAGKEPYAVSVRGTGGVGDGVITARQNLNTVYTGHREIKRPDGTTLEFVTTADAEYVRGHDATGSWLRTRRSGEGSEGSVFDFGGYASVLLAEGPAARKGMETRDGVPVFHLAGHLDQDQLARASGATSSAAKLQGVTGLDLDQWIDAQGRTRYVEERLTVDGKPVVAKIAFSDFGPAEIFAAPTGTIV